MRKYQMKDYGLRESLATGLIGYTHCIACLTPNDGTRITSCLTCWSSATDEERDDRNADFFSRRNRYIHDAHPTESDRVFVRATQGADAAPTDPVVPLVPQQPRLRCEKCSAELCEALDGPTGMSLKLCFKCQWDALT